MKKMQDDFARKSDPNPDATAAPVKLDAPLDSTGLALVHVLVSDQKVIGTATYDSSAIAIQRVDGPYDVVLVKEFSSGLVVFQELKPGTDRLLEVRVGDNDSSGKVILDDRDDPQFSFEVGAGETRYFGRLTIRDASVYGTDIQ